jgi:hypothetical protein
VLDVLVRACRQLALVQIDQLAAEKRLIIEVSMSVSRSTEQLQLCEWHHCARFVELYNSASSAFCPRLAKEPADGGPPSPAQRRQCSCSRDGGADCGDGGYGCVQKVCERQAVQAILEQEPARSTGLGGPGAAWSTD